MRKIARLSLVAGTAAAVIGGAVAAAPSMAAPGGGACSLNGTATFGDGNPATPDGVGNPSGAFVYSFSGALTNCYSSTAKGADQSGTISAGRAFNYAGASYTPVAADTPTGTGDCTKGTTKGTAVVQWADGTDTFITYTTTSAAAGVQLSGKVVNSIQAVNSAGATVTLTATNTVYTTADTAQGLLAFEVTDPTQCAPGGATVQSAGIDGATGIGHTS